MIGEEKTFEMRTLLFLQSSHTRPLRCVLGPVKWDRDQVFNELTSLPHSYLFNCLGELLWSSVGWAFVNQVSQTSIQWNTNDATFYKVLREQKVESETEMKHDISCSNINRRVNFLLSEQFSATQQNWVWSDACVLFLLWFYYWSCEWNRRKIWLHVHSLVLLNCLS